ncbi:MAG TPA: hypothetical protein VHV76_04185, partial [Mycobacteriales bacterium]|nr:hypothetical protein [Mycobacteriales bacterium]
MRRVKTVAALAALVAATGCAASAAAAPRDDPTVSAAPIAAAAPVVSTNAAVMRGHGALAFVSHHELYLLRGSGLRTVDLPGRATKPMWSHDSRWLAVSVSPAPPKSNPYQPEPTSIWLVSAAGKVVRRLAKCGFGTTGSWSPTADRLEVTCDSDKRDAVEVVGTGGAKTHIVSANEVSGAAWSPDGARIA